MKYNSGLGIVNPEKQSRRQSVAISSIQRSSEGDHLVRKYVENTQTLTFANKGVRILNAGEIKM